MIAGRTVRAGGGKAVAGEKDDSRRQNTMGEGIRSLFRNHWIRPPGDGLVWFTGGQSSVSSLVQRVRHVRASFVHRSFAYRH